MNPNSQKTDFEWWLVNTIANPTSFERDAAWSAWQAAQRLYGPDDVAKDAARYRWWQERYFGDDAAMDEINDAFRNMIGFTKPEVDAAIDAVLYATDCDGGIDGK